MQNIRIMRSKLIFFLLIPILILASWLLYNGLTFRITGTNPGINKVATVSPFFKISFNKALSSKDIVLSSSLNIVNAYSVSGRVLNISLKEPLQQSTSYTISISRIKSESGKEIINKSFTFRAEYISESNLPKDQQQALLRQQINHPLSRNSIYFSGANNLLTYGVTLAQLEAFKQAVFMYSNKIKNVSINASSIKLAPHDPNSSSVGAAMNFSLIIDDKDFSAKIEYSNLTTLRLFLYDSSGSNLIYDSQNIDGTKIG
jgi:hypothetical protein